ncbi:unnamed protein product [Cylindrotheca closterium]|uniref:PDZ domain-containing protein n=1 Tax=Cylindrotheca closterium TaxID=2856 RepID=A0AAD2CSJ8_9STRA|nr:unnamed protein product [Cylindrotheca closterium]
MTTTMMRFGALLCLLSQISQATAQTNFDFLWAIALYGNITASPGDTVTFNYGANHDVWIHPTGTCVETGKIAVGALGASPATYAFTDADLGSTITFACDTGSHCESGQIINFQIVPATPSPTVAPPVVQPSLMPSAASEVPSKSPSAAPISPAPSIAPSTAAPTTAAPVVATPSPTVTPVIPATPSPTVTPATPSPTVTAATPSPTAAPITPLPTAAPTIAPVTAAPTIAPVTGEPTVAPITGEPTAAPITGEPTKEPTLAPTLAPEPSAAPSGGPEITTETATDLSQTLQGMTECDELCQQEWASQMFESTVNYFARLDADFTVVTNTPKITSVELPTRRRLQGGSSGVVVNYDHEFQYTSEGDTTVRVYDLAAQPLATSANRNQFVANLKSRGDFFTDLTGVTSIDSPDTPAPTGAPVASPGTEAEDDDPLLSRNAIIGIAAGGGVIVLALIGFLCCRKKDNGQDGSGPPPDVLKVNHGRDEVSTLGGPDRPYGDQSVATVDYDYSKAYGGGGDTSVSEAGGTYGSNNQGLLDPVNAGATGGALGGFDTGGSFEDAYRATGGNVKEDLIHVFAPPGKLGVVIDTPDDGAPVVHAVKDSSIIADKIQVGDKLVAVDDEDVRAMTAIKVSKLISRKSANPSRKLSIIRTTVIE